MIRNHRLNVVSHAIEADNDAFPAKAYDTKDLMSVQPLSLSLAKLLIDPLI